MKPGNAPNNRAPENYPREVKDVYRSKLRSTDNRVTAFIQAEGVEVNFGKVQALRGVDLSLYPGEIAVMMGPNGAGKSTLLAFIDWIDTH